jgi:BirA family biotin operon repressor/biotin-[acetyl-CoA-carboxylase] ligase
MKYLDIDYIKENLRTREFGQKIFYFEKLDSTSSRLSDYMQNNERQGTVIIAEQQTAGRGRQGNVWYSPPNLGLYFSILLRPEQAPIRLNGLTLALGTSAAEAIERTSGAAIEVKWPNDMFSNGRKVGGILTEMHFKDGTVFGAIVGMGINVNNEMIPLELCETASSLYLESGKACVREDLLVAVLSQMEADYESFLEQGFKPFSERLTPRFFLKNKWISVKDDRGELVEGVVTGFDAEGGLLLIKEDGGSAKCSTGTVMEISR